jgi:hypothetical protein
VGKEFFRATLMSLAILRVSAQDTITPARDPKIFDKYESQIAQTFESLRHENNLPKLSRITHRQDLDQLVCTAALNDANPRRHNSPAALMYKTSDPESVTEEMKSIARFNQVETPPNSRFAVAVWPGIEKQTGRHIYWVGVQIYPSAFFEFIDNTFTDNRSYRNDWKKLVAPSCRDVR